MPDSCVYNDSKLESFDSEFSESPSCLLLINLAAFEIKKIPDNSILLYMIRRERECMR